MTILSEGITPAAYLERFIEGSLDNGDLVGVVDFSDDPDVKTPSRSIRVPLSKLVIGLANGWADNGDDKTLFVSTREFDAAWTALRAKGIEPRGAGFWTIDEEGTRGAYFARELNRTILHASNEIS
jgi:beta-glucosidase